MSLSKRSFARIPGIGKERSTEDYRIMNKSDLDKYTLSYSQADQKQNSKKGRL
jgi:hypothetical protein